MRDITEMPRGIAALCTVLSLLVAGGLDYLSGTEIRAFPLYFVSVCLAAWHFGKGAVFFVVLAAAITWVSVKFLGGVHYSEDYIWPLNAFSQFLTFGIVASLIYWARELLAHERALSNTDRLTGLLNSRGFFSLVNLAVANSRRSRQPFTLAYIDLDNFKCVNDNFGHQRGDELLQSIASVLRGTLRQTDIYARLGGDEFIVCLPGASSVQAEQILERIRGQIVNTVPDNKCHVSASIGGLSWSEPPEDIDAMITAADTQMYEIKKAGKNRVKIVSI